MKKPEINTKKIGVFDSGIGGLTVANAIIDLLPFEPLLYFGDTARLPYGTKSIPTIKKYSIQITEWLLAHGAKIIVVACNTATAAALNSLRRKFPDIPFVGMEPAVKPAAEASITAKVGVLATQGTFKSQRYAGLMERFAKDVEVFENPCLGLVELIEQGNFKDKALKKLLQKIIEPMLKKNVDTLVLGCTHYPLVQPLIREIAGKDVKIINPAPAVARQTKRLLKQQNLLSLATSTPNHRFYVSGSKESILRTLPFIIDERAVVRQVQL